MIETLGIFTGEVSPTDMKLATKINELVDAVNELQAQVAILQEHAHPTAKTEPEYKNRNVKQAEKWMYCLCRFWNDGCDSYYGELVNIDTKVSSDAPFERDTGDWYQCCEPVKPDDDIIYKGGDNE